MVEVSPKDPTLLKRYQDAAAVEHDTDRLLRMIWCRLAHRGQWKEIGRDVRNRSITTCIDEWHRCSKCDQTRWVYRLVSQRWKI